MTSRPARSMSRMAVSAASSSISSRSAGPRAPASQALTATYHQPGLPWEPTTVEGMSGRGVAVIEGSPLEGRPRFAGRPARAGLLESLDAGAPVEDPRRALHDRGVVGEGLRGGVVGRTALRLEVAELVDATDQQGAVALAGHLPDVGRDVADGEADAPVLRAVGRGAVEHAHVVQRHLARPQHDVDGPRLVDLHGDLLTPAQEVLGREGVAMG